MLAHRLLLQAEAAVELGRIGQVEAEARGSDELPALALDAVGELAHAVDLQLHTQYIARRGGAGDELLRPCRKGQQAGCRQDGGEAVDVHGVSLSLLRKR
jgi:hypothetical protein